MQEEMIFKREDEASGMAEWRIPIAGGAASGTTEFRHSDFRNPRTGGPMLPTDLYVELVRRVRNESDAAKWKLVTFILALYLSIVLLPSLVNMPNTF